MAKKQLYYIGLNEMTLGTTEKAVCAINGRITGMIQGITRDETGWFRISMKPDETWLIHDVYTTRRKFNKLKLVITEQLETFMDHIRFSE